MLFRMMSSEGVQQLFELLADANRVIAPIHKATDYQGNPIHAFEPVETFKQVALEYTTTRISAKKWFLPSFEELARFTINGGQWSKTVDFNAEKPLVLFGLHACDINALNRLDKVLMLSSYPMPWYMAKRKNMFIVGLDCTPAPHCFCRSMGADTALGGFDLFLSDLGDGEYFVEVLSSTAFALLKNIKTHEPDEADHLRYRHHVQRRNDQFTCFVDTTDLTKILDMEFQSEVWEQWGSKCLSCGSCAAVCPTCYCYGVEERVDLDLQHARKLKRLHSCNLVDFAQVAGGHNFRPESSSRLKYRYYHKHRGFVEAYEEPLCVGCGRCGLSCLAGITVADVIQSVRQSGEIIATPGTPEGKKK